MIGLVVGALATWCAASLLYYHKWFQWLRDRCACYADPPTWAGQQLNCFWCVCIWVGLVFAPLAIWYWIPLTPLALAGAAMLLSGGGRVIWRTMQE